MPTCRITDRVGDVRDRARDVCVVVDEERVVLGLVDAEALAGDPATPVGHVMQSAPVTFRPNVGAGKLPEYLTKQRILRALVTTSDGVLVGLLRLGDLERRGENAGTAP